MRHNRYIIDDRTAAEKAKAALLSACLIGRDIFGFGCLMVAAVGAYGWWNT